MVGQPVVQNQFSAMMDKVKAANVVIAGLQRQTEADRRRLMQLERSVESRREEAANRGDGREKWAELQGSVQGLMEEMQELRRRVESLDERLWARTQGSDHSKKRTQELEQQVQALEQNSRLAAHAAEETQKRQAAKLRRSEHSLDDLTRRLSKIEEEARSNKDGGGQRISYLETRVAEVEQQQEQLHEHIDAELQSVHVAIEGYHSVNAVGGDGVAEGHDSLGERHAAMEDRLEAAERALGAVEKKVSDFRMEDLSKTVASLRVKVDGQMQRVSTLAERLETAHEPALDALRAELSQVRSQDRRESEAHVEALRGRVQEAHDGHEENLSEVQDQIRQLHSHIAALSLRPEEEAVPQHVVRSMHDRIDSHEREVSDLRERLEAHPAFSQPGHHGGGTTPEEGVARSMGGEDAGQPALGAAEYEDMQRRMEWLEEQISTNAAAARQQNSGPSPQTHNTVCDLVEQVSRLSQRASSNEASHSSMADKVQQLQLHLERSNNEDSVSTRGLTETSAKVGALTTQVADMAARLLEVEGHIEFSKESGLPPFRQASGGAGGGPKSVPPLPCGQERGIEASEFNVGDRSPATAPLDIQDKLTEVACHLEVVDELERRIEILEHRLNGDDDVSLSLGNKMSAKADGEGGGAGAGAAALAEADGKAIADLQDRLETVESSVKILQEQRSQKSSKESTGQAATPRADASASAGGEGLDFDKVQDMIDDLSSKVTSTITAVVDDLARLETATEDRARETESALSGFSEAIENLQGETDQLREALEESSGGMAKRVDELGEGHAAHAKQVEQLSNDFSGHRAEVEKLCLEWTKHREKFDSAFESHDEHREEVKKILEEWKGHKEGVDALKSEHEKRSSVMDALKSQFENYSSKVEDLHKDKKPDSAPGDEFHQQLAALESKVASLTKEAKVESVEDSLSEIRKLQEAHSAKVEQLVVSRDLHTEHLDELKKKVAAGPAAPTDNKATEELLTRVTSVEERLAKNCAEIAAIEGKNTEVQASVGALAEKVDAGDQAAAMACEKTVGALTKLKELEHKLEAASEKATAAAQAASTASEKAASVEKLAAEAVEKAEAASGAAAASSEKAVAAEKVAAAASAKAAEAATAPSGELKEAPAASDKEGAAEAEAVAKEAMGKVDKVREEMKELISRLDEQADIATKTMEAVKELSESVPVGDKVDALSKEVQLHQETVSKLEGNFEKRFADMEATAGEKSAPAGESGMEAKLAELQERLEAAEKIALESATSPSGGGEASIREQVQAEVASCVSKVQDELKQLTAQHEELKDTKMSLDDLSETVASLNKGVTTVEGKVAKVEERLKSCESTSNAIKKEFESLAGPRKVGIGMASDGPSPLAAFRGTISDLTAQVADLQSRFDSAPRGGGGSAGARVGTFDPKEASLDFSLTEQSRFGSKDHPGDSLNFSLTESRKDLSISESTLPAGRRTPHTLQPILGRSGSPNSSASFDSDAGSSPKSAGSTPSSATSKDKKPKKHKDHKEHKVKSSFNDGGDFPDIQAGRHKLRSDSAQLDGGGGDDALDSLVSGGSRSGPRDRPRPSPVVTNFDDERGQPLATVAEEEELGDTGDQSLSQKSKSKEEGGTPAGNAPFGGDSPASASGGVLDASLVSNSSAMFGGDMGGGVDFSVDDSTELEKCDHIEVVMPITKSEAPSSAASADNAAPAAPAKEDEPVLAGEAEDVALPPAAARAASHSGPPSQSSRGNSPRSRGTSRSPRSHSDASTPAGTPAAAAKPAPRPASAAIGLGGASSAPRLPGDDDQYGEDSFADDISVPEESIEDASQDGSEEV